MPNPLSAIRGAFTDRRREVAPGEEGMPPDQYREMLIRQFGAEAVARQEALRRPPAPAPAAAPDVMGNLAVSTQ